MPIPVIVFAVAPMVASLKYSTDNASSLILAMALPINANTQGFGNFSVNVPSGWKGELQGQALIVKSQSVNASAAVAFAQMGGASFTDIVERLYIQMNGENLQQDDGSLTIHVTRGLMRILKHLFLQ